MPNTPRKHPSARRATPTFRPRLTQLEDRSTPAAITLTGVTADIVLDQTNEQVTFTTTAAGVVSVSSTAGVTLNGVPQSPPVDLIGVTVVNVTDFAAGTGVTFGTSSEAYIATFTVTLDNAPGQVIFNGSSSFGDNDLSVTTTHDVVVLANVTATTGDISISANQQATPTAGDLIGILVVRGDIRSDSGTITLAGRGGDNGSDISNVGVLLESNDGISRVIGGTVVITGQGGSSSGSSTFNAGVWLAGGSVVSSTAGGSVTVTGTGGESFGSTSPPIPPAGNNIGVLVNGGSTIASGGLGAVTVTGTGGTGGEFNVGVAVQDTGSRITSGGGAVAVTGTGGTGDGGGHSGVVVTDALISAGGDGAVVVTGSGGSGGGGNFGVAVELSVGTSSAITSGGGSVDVTGNGGSGNGGGSSGVVLAGSGAVITSGGGAVTVTGSGGTSGGVEPIGSNSGVLLLADSTITAGGLGAVVVTGTGGTAGSFNTGVSVFELGSRITSGGGAVTVTGTGGSGAGGNHDGVSLNFGGISAGGSGAVVVTGTGGSGAGGNNRGVSQISVAAQITSGGGTVDVTGTGGSGPNSPGLFVIDGGTIASGGTAALTLTADSIEFDDAAFIRAGVDGLATATLRPNTAATLVQLGGADAAGTLGLTDAELDRVTAGTLIIGRANSGALTVTAPVTRPVATAVQLVSGGDITFGGGVNTGGGTLLVAPTTGFLPTAGLTDATASTVSLTTGSDLRIDIGGTVQDTGYTQLNVSGSLDITGVDLVLSGGYVPLPGDVFFVATGTSLTGTFTGLPNGAVVTFNGVAMNIFYTPSSAFLRVNRTPTGLTAGGPYAINEGDGLTVTASPATDPDEDPLTYTWDVNGDGTFGDESAGTVSNGGLTVTFTAAQLATLGLNDGPRAVTLAVRASDGFANGTVTATGTLTINNVAPVIAISGPPTAVEGAVYTLTLGTVADPGPDTVTAFTVDWGDGTSDTFTTNGPKTHTYADDGVYSITVDLTDEDGTFTNVANLQSVTVTNVAPTISISGPPTADEGAVYTLTLGAVNDPGSDTVSAFRVNWGDGTSDTFTTPGPKTHTYADQGLYAITVDLTDEDGTFTDAANPLSVTVSNVAPTITVSGPATVAEGSLYTVTLGTITDPGTDTVASYRVNWGDGTFDTFSTAGPKTHTYADSGTFNITVDLTDEDGTSTNAGNPFAVTVTNVAPAISISGPPTVAEASVYTLTLGGVTDPGTDTVTAYRVNWGDGTSDTFTTPGPKTHTYADNGTYAITVDLTDEDGTFTNAANPLSVTVNNVAPTITSLTVPPTGDVGSAVTVSATATDPAGAADPLTFAWAVTLNGLPFAGGTGETFTFTPTTDGTYVVALTVTDGDGGSATGGGQVAVVFVAEGLVVSNAGQVRAFNPDGSTRDFDPFPGFFGDVTVASADLNFDGVADVVTGAGAGGGPHVKVFDGRTGAELASFYAYAESFTGGVFVAATTDGRVVTGAGAFGGPHVKVFTPLGQELADFFAYGQSFNGGVRVAAGDVTGDGRPDIVTGAGPGGGPHVKVFDGVTLAEVRSFFAFAPSFTGGVYVAAADGRIAVGAGTWGGPHVQMFNQSGAVVASFFPYPAEFVGGVVVSLADTNADGVADVITGPGLGGGLPVQVFSGTDFSLVESIDPFDPLDPLGVFVGGGVLEPLLFAR